MKKITFLIELHDNTIKLQDAIVRNVENPIYDVDAALSFIVSNISGSILIDESQMIDTAAVAADTIVESYMSDSGPEINLNTFIYNLSNWAVSVTNDIKNSLLKAGVYTLEINELHYTRGFKDSNGKLIYVELL